MWTPLITIGVLVLLALTVAAGSAALVVTDHRRAQRAVAILKVMLGAVLGSSSVLALVGPPA